MAVGGGYSVRSRRLDEVSAAAAQVADGVMAVGDGVAQVATTPLDQYGEWLLGDTSIDLIAPWDEFLHTFTEEIRTFGSNVGKASKLYSGAEEKHGAMLRGILS